MASKMIETASNAGPRLALEVCLILPHPVPGVPTPKDEAALEDGVDEATEPVGIEEGVTVVTASDGEDAVLDAAVALADARTLGQNSSPHFVISIESFLAHRIVRSGYSLCSSDMEQLDLAKQLVTDCLMVRPASPVH